MVAERGRPRLAQHIVDVLVPLIMEEIVEVLETVFQEQISERICKQIVEQAAEVPKTSSRDRTLQRTVEQILNVPLPEVVTQLVEVPETISPDRIQQRTVEQIVDAPVPQAVEELAEVSRVFSQDRIQQCAMEQTTPAISLAGKIVEMPVTRKTQQVVNPHVQHVVNTVEVEKPKIIDETVQKPNIQEKINQVTKHIKIPQVQFVDKAGDTLVDVQRQIPMAQTVQKTMEIPQLQCVDKVVDVPVVLVVQAPQMQVSEKTVEISQLQAPQVHLTGAMKPNDPDAKIKFFTEEVLHGVGGPVFDTHGNRVANELRGRNCVTGEMKKNKLPSRLDLNSAVSDDTAWQCKQYAGRGVRKLHESGTAPAEDMEALVLKTPDSIKAHFQASLKTARNPNGEPYPRLRAISHGMKLLARQ